MRRPCEICGKMFEKTGKRDKQCYKCWIDKWRGRNVKKRK